VRDLVNQFFGEPKYLLRDVRYEPESEDEARHLFFPGDFDAEGGDEEVVVHMCASAGGHDFDGGSHALEGNVVGGGGGGDEILEESDKGGDVGGLEAGEVE